MPGPHLLCDLGRAFPCLLPALLVTGHWAALGLWLYHSHGDIMASWLYIGTTVSLDGATLRQELILTRCLQRGRSWQSGKPLACVLPPSILLPAFLKVTFRLGSTRDRDQSPQYSPHTLRGIPFSLPLLTSIPAILTWGPLYKRLSLGIHEPSQNKRKPLISAF